MESISLKNISDFIGKTVSLKGWLQIKRGNNHIQFLQIRNSGRIIQVVVEKDKFSEEDFTKIKSFHQEMSLELIGTVVESIKSDLGYEIILDSYSILGDSIDYPITPKSMEPIFYITIVTYGYVPKGNWQSFKSEMN
jgi:asparaginyl-tRNA synthetase